MKACIFDLDGTLTDSLESLAYSVKATLREMDLPEITTDECRRFVGDGARCLMERSLRATGEENVKRIEEAMEIYGRIFDENCTYHVTPYEGICQILSDLKKEGVKLAVLSNKPDQQTVKVVHEIFGEDVFDYAQGQIENIKRKPEPDGIYCLLEKMNVTKEECLYVGDSEVDVKTGKNAGLKTICVLWGFRDRKTLEAAGAQVMIDRPEELLQFV